MSLSQRSARLLRDPSLLRVSGSLPPVRSSLMSIFKTRGVKVRRAKVAAIMPAAPVTVDMLLKKKNLTRKELKDINLQNLARERRKQFAADDECRKLDEEDFDDFNDEAGDEGVGPVASEDDHTDDEAPDDDNDNNDDDGEDTDDDLPTGALEIRTGSYNDDDDDLPLSQNDSRTDPTMDDVAGLASHDDEREEAEEVIFNSPKIDDDFAAPDPVAPKEKATSSAANQNDSAYFEVPSESQIMAELEDDDMAALCSGVFNQTSESTEAKADPQLPIVDHTKNHAKVAPQPAAACKDGLSKTGSEDACGGNTRDEMEQESFDRVLTQPMDSEEDGADPAEIAKDCSASSPKDPPACERRGEVRLFDSVMKGARDDHQNSSVGEEDGDRDDQERKRAKVTAARERTKSAPAELFGTHDSVCDDHDVDDEHDDVGENEVGTQPMEPCSENAIMGAGLGNEEACTYDDDVDVRLEEREKFNIFLRRENSQSLLGELHGNSRSSFRLTKRRTSTSSRNSHKQKSLSRENSLLCRPESSLEKISQCSILRQRSSVTSSGPRAYFTRRKSVSSGTDSSSSSSSSATAKRNFAHIKK